MHVPGRTFPVDTRYLEDAVELTKWSVSEGSQYARRSMLTIPHKETHLIVFHQLMTSSIATRIGPNGRKKRRLQMKTIQNFRSKISS
jgi:HrpA-like RNA helicase